MNIDNIRAAVHSAHHVNQIIMIRRIMRSNKRCHIDPGTPRVLPFVSFDDAMPDHKLPVVPVFFDDGFPNGLELIRNKRIAPNLAKVAFRVWRYWSDRRGFNA